MATYRVKNWHKFQHFKERRILWIKLYKELLDDPEYHSLDPLAAKYLTLIWLVASDDQGNLPCITKLAFRLRITEKATESIISKLSHWLEQVDINLISSGYQPDALEERREEERRREEKRVEGEGDAPTIVGSPVIPKRFVAPTVEEIAEYCTARNNMVNPHKFHAHYTANGWRVGKNPMKNWKAAVVTWENN